LHKLKWDDELCGLFQTRKEWLAPKVLQNTGLFGTFSRDSAADGIAVTASLGDQHASLVGHGCLDQDCAKLTLGTGCFLLRTVHERDVTSAAFDGLIKTIGHHLRDGEPPVYAVEASVSAGGNMITWLVEHLEILRDKEQIDEIIKLPNSELSVAHSVYFLPALTGLLAPYWKPDTKASFHGLSLNSRRHELVLAVVESIAFACCQVIALSKQGDPTRIKLDGGLTKCSTLMTILATTLKSPVCIAEESNSTALGAAIAARVGHIGQPPIYTTAPLRFVAPMLDLVDHYAEKYQCWLKLMDNSFKN
jgi:glycerol kinase